jgi:hypothetical protein
MRWRARQQAVGGQPVGWRWGGGGVGRVGGVGGVEVGWVGWRWGGGGVEVGWVGGGGS